MQSCRRGQQLLDLNGVIREDGENISSLAKRVARQYVKDLIREHDGDHLRIAVTAGREPTGQHDLSLDWPGLVDDNGRMTDPTVLTTLVETLADIRVAPQAKSACPHITVEPHLRLPLAMLVGWEWNRVRPVKLTVEQPSPAGMQTVEDTTSDPRRWGGGGTTAHDGGGPAVVAVAVGKGLADTVERYAAEQRACETRYLHVALDDLPGRMLAPEGITSLAEWTAQQLAELNQRDVEKHLLLLSPASLAVRIGAAANGTGRTWVPFWDGGANYTSGVHIG